MPRRRLYQEPLHKLKGSTSPDYVEGRAVDPGLVLYVTHASLEDETTAPTTLAFGKKVGDRFEGLEEGESPSVGVRYHTGKTHHFTEGERPVWRVEGGATSDVLRGFMEGYYEEVS